MDDQDWHIGWKAFVLMLGIYAVRTYAGTEHFWTALLSSWAVVLWLQHRHMKRQEEEAKRWWDETRRRP
jgi:hypothetical protein